MPRGTSRNRVHSGIRTRFLDQVSVAAFRPIDQVNQEANNYLLLNNIVYGDTTTQTGTGTSYDSDGRINGYSEVIFRNANIASIPAGLNDTGNNKFDVFINGLFLEKTAFISNYPQNSGNDLVLRIDNTLAALENNLDSNDLITIKGKINAIS